MDIFIPDRSPSSAALSRTTHLGIGAHPDDLEFMALHGIEACHTSMEDWFGGVVVTDGAGSARSGEFAETSDAAMQAIRAEEQRDAARIGRYGFVAQLGYPSTAVRDATQRGAVVRDLAQLIEAAKPRVVYTHNPFDKHPTHIAVLTAVLYAIRAMDPGIRPSTLYGCEVWRGLDWLPDDLKVVLPVGRHSGLARELGAVFQSQIAGGKRYDRAVEGRYSANATFADSHSVDHVDQAAYAIDLTPLIRDDGPTLQDFTDSVLEQFSGVIRNGLEDA